MVPAYTCSRVGAAIRAAGWIPAWVDLMPGTLSIDPVQVGRTLAQCNGPVAIIATHLHGIPEPIGPLRAMADDYGAVLIEDCAMAQGALDNGAFVGGAGDWSIFSFGVGKVVGLGGGGLVLSDQAITAMPRPRDRSMRWLLSVLTRCGSLGSLRYRSQELVKRWTGGRLKSESTPGFEPTACSPRMNAWLARLLDHPCLEEGMAQRSERGRQWSQFVSELACARLALPEVPSGVAPCHPGLPLLVADRDALQASLRALGVQSSRQFDYCAARVDGDSGAFPQAESVARRILVLPLEPEIDAVADQVRQVLRDYAAGG